MNKNELTRHFILLTTNKVLKNLQGLCIHIVTNTKTTDIWLKTNEQKTNQQTNNETTSKNRCI